MPVAATPLSQFANVTTASTVNLDTNFLQSASGAYLWGGLAGGTANALVIDGLVPLTDYIIGMSVRFLATNNNLAACTLAYDALPPYALTDISGTALTANAIVTGNVYEAQLVQTASNVIQWRLLGGNGAGGAVSSVFGRTGAIVATAGDYAIGQISGTGDMATQSSAAVAITGGTLTGIAELDSDALVVPRAGLTAASAYALVAGPATATVAGTLAFRIPITVKIGASTVNAYLLAYTGSH